MLPKLLLFFTCFRKDLKPKNLVECGKITCSQYAVLLVFWEWACKNRIIAKFGWQNVVKYIQPCKIANFVYFSIVCVHFPHVIQSTWTVQVLLLNRKIYACKTKVYKICNFIGLYFTTFFKMFFSGCCAAKSMCWDSDEFHPLEWFEKTPYSTPFFLWEAEMKKIIFELNHRT